MKEQSPDQERIQRSRMQAVISRIFVQDLNRSDKAAFVSALLSGLVLYNKWITRLIINPDVLLNGIVYKYGMQWEDSLGRIGLRPVAYMKGLFVLPGFTALLCIFLNSIVALLLCRLFSIKKTWVAVCAGIILCCSPSFCEMMTYYYCSDAYMWACICSVLFVLFAGKKGNVRFCVAAALLLALSLSLYQAYLGTAVALSLFYILFSALVRSKPFKDIVYSFFRMCVSGVSGILIYLVTFWIYCVLNGANPSERIGGMGSFPANRIVMLIKQSYGAFYNFYIGNAKFYHKFMNWGRINLALIVLLYAVIIWKTIYKRNEIQMKLAAFVIILSLLIPAGIMSICIYASTVSVYGVTGILMIPHINYIYVFLMAMLFEDSPAGPGKKAAALFRGAGIVLTAAISFVLILYTQAYAASVEQDFNQADTVAGIMINRLSELPEYRPGMKLAVFGDYRDGNFPRCGSGSWEPTELEDIVKGTGVEWGCFWPDTGGREGCWLSFLAYYKGCWFTEIENGEELESISKSEEYNNMAVFPLDGSVRMIGDTAVVRLAE